MSDVELQALARRWSETGAVDDETAYLRAQLKAGQLEPERLALAAYLSQAAAGRLTEVEPFGELPVELPDYGWEPCARALLALAREVRAVWEARAPEVGEAFAAVEVWVTEPVFAHQQRAAEALSTCRPEFDDGVEFRGHALLHAAWAIARDRANEDDDMSWEARYEDMLQESFDDSAFDDHAEAALRRLCDEVSRWALGRT